MNQSAFRRIFLFIGMILLLLGSVHVNAQDVENNHFIYIQAKEKVPFYVILDKKVYSSSSIGYLIIPKLKDGTYDLRIGFPKTQQPEKNFTCEVKGGDAGYSLEKGDNGELGLLNLQTKSFIASSSQTSIEDQYAAADAPKVEEEEADAAAQTTPKKSEEKAAPESNAFGDMLSSVSNDPSLSVPIETPKAELPQSDEKISTQVADFGNNPDQDNKAIAEAAEASGETLKPAEQVLGDVSKTYGVIKSGQDRSRSGTEMTFIMFNSRSTDTVKILVPKIKALADKDETTGVEPEKISKKESLALFTNTEQDSFNVDPSTTRSNRAARKKRKAEKKFVDIDANSGDVSSEVEGGVNNPFYDKSKAGNDDTDLENKNESRRIKEKAAKLDEELSNSAIAEEAPACDPISEKNYNKMQKKMIAKNNDNDMIAIVDKYIKDKCLTTSQVKHLGGLFLSDAGRYALFQDSYSHVSDKENFPSLENQLLDSYFKKRFQQILQ